MPIYVAGNDSGGREGVTPRAYDFWRSLKQQGLQGRLKVLKGANRQDAKRIEERWPDAANPLDKLTVARGDVPVWFLNTTIFKDAIVGDLAVDVPGPGYVHIPDWLDRTYIAEYVAEVRGPDGWKKQGKARNEQFDLHVYGRALVAIIGAERIDWEQPPLWAIRPSESSKPNTATSKPALSRMEQLAAAMHAR